MMNQPKTLTVAQQLEVAAHWLDEADTLASIHKHYKLREQFKRVARECRVAAAREAA